MKAAIYARISLDRDGDADGTQRQLEDCRALCAARHWDVAGEYVDNDVSAYSGRRRPEFERLLEDLRAGDVDTVVVWKTDRLARRGRDLQRFLDASPHTTLTSCTEPEFTGATGLLLLRILSGFAEHESGVKAERVARKMRQKRERGDPHSGGARCYGYSPNGRELVAHEAANLREAAARLLAGETISDVLRDWNERGVQTVRGGTWQASNVWKLLRSPRLAGLVEVDGKLLAGTFPAVLDRKAWDRIRSMPQRRHSAPRRSLLGGLLYCGRCGAKMVGSVDAYKCSGDGCWTAITKGIDSTVAGAVVRLLERSGITSFQKMHEGDDSLELLQAAEADLAQLVKDHYVKKIVPRPVFLEVQSDLQDRVKQLRRQVGRRSTVLADVEPAHLAEQWDTKSPSWKRALLGAVVERVDVAPAVKGQRPEDRLTWTWRG